MGSGKFVWDAWHFNKIAERIDIVEPNMTIAVVIAIENEAQKQIQGLEPMASV